MGEALGSWTLMPNNVLTLSCKTDHELQCIFYFNFSEFQLILQTLFSDIFSALASQTKSYWNINKLLRASFDTKTKTELYFHNVHFPWICEYFLNISEQEVHWVELERTEYPCSKSSLMKANLDFISTFPHNTICITKLSANYQISIDIDSSDISQLLKSQHFKMHTLA